MARRDFRQVAALAYDRMGVFELGIVMWIFLGWEFTLAEFVGGLFLIVLMWIGIRYFIPRRLEEEAREREARTGEEEGPAHA